MTGKAVILTFVPASFNIRKPQAFPSRAQYHFVSVQTYFLLAGFLTVRLCRSRRHCWQYEIFSLNRICDHTADRLLIGNYSIFGF